MPSHQIYLYYLSSIAYVPCYFFISQGLYFIGIVVFGYVHIFLKYCCRSNNNQHSTNPKFILQRVECNMYTSCFPFYCILQYLLHIMKYVTSICIDANILLRTVDTSTYHSIIGITLNALSFKRHLKKSFLLLFQFGRNKPSLPASGKTKDSFTFTKLKYSFNRKPSHIIA